MVTLLKAKRDGSNDEQLDHVEEIVDVSSPSVEFKGLAATSNFEVSISTPLSQSSAPPITGDISNLPIQNKHQKNQDNDHANVLSRLPFTSALTDGDMIYFDQVPRGTRSLDRRSFDALSSATVSNSDTNVTIYFFEREEVSITELKQIEIISSKVTPSPQFLAATSSSSERQVDTIVSTRAQMNNTFVGSVLLSAQFLADSSVPTLPDTNSLGEIFPDDVSSMTEIRRIIEPRDRSIDSSLTDSTEPKAQFRKLYLMNCEHSALETIASAEIFIQHESSLDAIASAPGRSTYFKRIPTSTPIQQQTLRLCKLPTVTRLNLKVSYEARAHAVRLI